MNQTFRHLAWLLLVTTAVQIWSARHAVTAALDAVRYVALADAMQEQGWLATIRKESEHPLFPTLVWLTRDAVREVWGEFPELNAASVMLASSWPLVLAIVPVYFLLRRLTDARAALIGGLCFAALPRIAMLGADGLSDSSHLLLATIGMWAIAEYVDRLSGRRVARPGAVNTAKATAICPAACLGLMAGGAALGLALTARVEALAVLPALALCIGWLQTRAATRRPWADWSVGLFSLAAGLVCTLGLYFVLIDAASPHAAWSRLLGRGDAPTAPLSHVGLDATISATYTQSLPDGARLAFDSKESTASSRFRGVSAAAQQYSLELFRTLQPAAGLLALCGLWLIARRGVQPAQRFAVCLYVVVSMLALLYASRAGYLQARHIMLAVVVAIAPVGVAIDSLAALFAGWVQRRGLSPRNRAATNTRGITAWAMAAAALATFLPITLRPLHASRAAHRQAADWLRQQGTQQSLVLDSRGLTGLYTGLPTRCYQAARRTFADPRLAYVIIEQNELEFDSPRAKTLRHFLSTSAIETARFASPTRDPRQEVVIYRWQPERFAMLMLPLDRVAGEPIRDQLRR